MRRSRKIHDLGTLEKEIYRLKLESKMTEARLDKNLDYFKDNYAYLFLNSAFSKKESNTGNGFKHSLFHNENLNSVISSVADHIADHATKGIKEKIEKLFGKT